MLVTLFFHKKYSYIYRNYLLHVHLLGIQLHMNL